MGAEELYFFMSEVKEVYIAVNGALCLARPWQKEAICSVLLEDEQSMYGMGYTPEFVRFRRTVLHPDGRSLTYKMYLRVSNRSTSSQIWIQLGDGKFHEVFVVRHKSQVDESFFDGTYIMDMS